jgi:transglutaminase-like putative cysteine protease
MRQYLANSEFIDSDHPAVVTQAVELRNGCVNDCDVAKRCFEFVRDRIRHSWDFKLNPVTCKASEALFHATGYCYAKSHLLAALLRANGIPAGLCYQRLTVEAGRPPYSLHGLNAVYLQGHGWYRIDARGNKVGVNAEFRPPVEQLAFRVVDPGEADLPEIWPEPLAVVIRALKENATYDQVYRNLPDILLWPSTATEEQERSSASGRSFAASPRSRGPVV